IFSGGSRVLPEGKLVAAQLRRAALSMGALVVGVSAVSAAWLQRPLFVPAAGVAIILSWAYSFPPLRLSYAGWGEATQGVGLGVVLPLLGWYAQAGTLQGFPWPALAPLFLLGFA